MTFFLPPVINLCVKPELFQHPWKRHQKKRLAKRLKIPPSYLSMILHRKRSAPRSLAAKIEKATNGAITRIDVLYPKESKNPLLF